MESNCPSGKSLFIVRKLDSSCYSLGAPVHPVRSMAHSFFFLTKGTVLVDIGDKSYLIKPGELAFVAVGRLFRVKYYDRSEGYMGNFCNSFISDTATTPTTPMHHFSFLRSWEYPIIPFEGELCKMVEMMLERIYQESHSAERKEEIIKAYLNVILEEANSIYMQTSKNDMQRNFGLGNRFLELLFSGKPIRLNVSEYADALNVTPNHLCKMVKKLTLRTPSEWIEEAIMQQAKILLKKTDLPLSDIATKVGIIDQSYFSRRFKKREGMTPSEYRSR